MQHCIVLYLAIYKALLTAKAFQKRSQCEQPEGKGRILVSKKMRRDYQKGWQSEPVEEVHSTEKDLCRRTCEGSGLSHRSPDTRNKKVKPIRGSERTQRSGREWAKHEIAKVLRSKTQMRLKD